MPAELPIIRIHDTAFRIDLRGMQFVQVDQPSNCISFDDVQDNITHCLILYDTATKNAFQGNWEELSRSNTVVEVRLPSLTELDPPTLAALILENNFPQEDLARVRRSLEQITNDKKLNSPKQKRK